MSLLFLSLLLLLIINVPIAISLGLSSLIFMVVKTDIPLTVIAQKMFNGTEGFTLIAIPLFMLAGNLMERGGLSEKIVGFAGELVGFIKGGLAMVAVVSSMFFAGISGSANADTAAMGSILIPAMRKKNYDVGMATTVVSTAGSIGVIIPPSIPMVMYASISNVSIGYLFLAGIVPGVLVGAALMGISYIIAVKEDIGTENKLSLKRIWATFKEAIVALGMPIIVLGGLFGGWFTATECAAIAVLYSFIVGKFVYKKIKLSDLLGICIKSAVTTSIPMLVVATSSVFAWLLSWYRIPEMLANNILSVTDNRFVILLLFNIMLLLLGTFMDGLPAIILTTPIILPIAIQYGMDPIFIGAMMVFNLAVGMSTPPVGCTLFVSCSIAGIKLPDTFKYLFWYIGAMIIVLLLITYIPDLVLFIPKLAGYGG